MLLRNVKNLNIFKKVVSIKIKQSFVHTSKNAKMQGCFYYGNNQYLLANNTAIPFVSRSRNLHFSLKVFNTNCSSFITVLQQPKSNAHLQHSCNPLCLLLSAKSVFTTLLWQCCLSVKTTFTTLQHCNLPIMPTILDCKSVALRRQYPYNEM